MDLPEALTKIVESVTTTPLQTIGSLVESHGLATTIVIVIAVIMLKRTGRQALSIELPGSPDNKTNITRHRLFETCNYWTNQGIDRIKFPSDRYPVRAKMYRFILHRLITNARAAATRYAPELVAAKDGYEWREKARQMVAEITRRTASDLEANGVPEIVIDLFIEWQSASVGYVLHSISTLGESSIADNHDRTVALLSAQLSALKCAFYDAERTLIHLNGQLTGKEYQGERIE